MALPITTLTGLVNVAIPEVYQKGMSYYEVLTAVVNKVNELIEQSNEYFGTDAKTLMIEIMNEWITDGTLDSLISDALLEIGDRQYTDQNYIISDETITSSLDILDQTVKLKSDESTAALSDLTGYIENIGKPGKKIGIETTSTAAEIETILNTQPDGTVVYFEGDYLFDQPVSITAKIKLVGNNATFKFDPAYDKSSGTLALLNINADEVEIKGITFDANGMTLASGNNWFIGVNNKNNKITDCHFQSLPGGGSNFNGAIGFFITAINGYVGQCTFDDCPGSVFFKSPNSHVVDCVATNPKDVSFALNGTTCIGSSVVNCKVLSDDTCSLHIAVEEGASDWIITGNYIRGIKNGIGIGAINVAYSGVVDGGIISNNIIDGGALVTTAPTAFIRVTNKYKHTIIRDNLLKNGVTGNANNAMLFIGSNNAIIENNTIYTGTASGFVFYFETAVTQLILRNNNIDCGGLSLAMIIVGDWVGAHFISENNIIRNTTEYMRGTGASNINYDLKDDRFFNVTNPLNIGQGYDDYFNTNDDYRFPYKIGGRRTLYGQAAPTTGTWAVGDTVYRSNPGAGSNVGWKCTTSGTPGTWKSFGTIES